MQRYHRIAALATVSVMGMGTALFANVAPAGSVGSDRLVYTRMTAGSGGGNTAYDECDETTTTSSSRGPCDIFTVGETDGGMNRLSTVAQFGETSFPIYAPGGASANRVSAYIALEDESPLSQPDEGELWVATDSSPSAGDHFGDDDPRFQEFIKRKRVADSAVAPSLAWSTNGSKLAYMTATNGDDDSVLFVTTKSGRKTAIDLPNNYRDASFPAWCRDGQKLVYFAETDSPCCDNKDIFISNSDGTGNPFNLSAAMGRADPGEEDAFPQYLPDNKHIVFMSEGGSPSGEHVMVVKSDGSDLVDLTAAAGVTTRSSWPVVSPNGKRIAFFNENAVCCAEDGQIVIIDPDGTDAVIVNDGGNDDIGSRWMRWSYDSTRLAFVRHEQGVCCPRSDALGLELRTVRADGTGANLVADRAQIGFTWSRNSQFLVFEQLTSGDFTDMDLYRVSATGTVGSATPVAATNKYGERAPMLVPPSSSSSARTAGCSWLTCGH